MAPTAIEPGLLDWIGHWTDLRASLAERGYRLDAELIADAGWVPSGGLDPGASSLRSLLDVSLRIETEPTLRLSGGTLLLGLQAIDGEDGSREIGVLQPISNIDAEDRLQLARVWYEQRFPEAGFTLRAGKMDANGLFAYTDEGARFLHSSAGVSPNILGIPTYPDPAFGAAGLQELGAGVEVRAGIFDGAGQEGIRTGSNGPATLPGSPSDLFLIGECDLSWSGAPGRLGIGAWRHTGNFARFDGGSEDGTAGLYLVLDQSLVEPVASEDHALGAFLRIAHADASVSAVRLHVGGGLVWSRPLALSNRQAFGVGFELAQLTDEPGAGFTADNELALETFYSFAPVRWLRLKPDVQYVVHPGGDEGLGNALVLGFRATLSL